MKYIIDTDILGKRGLSLVEFGLLVYFAGGGESMILTHVCESLWQKGYLIKGTNNKYAFDNFKFEELQTILAEGSNKKTTNKRAEELAPKMRALYPEGYKAVFTGGVQKKYPWRDSDRVIANRMKIFFKRYGDTFTDEQILDATERYTRGNKEDNTFMKLLKYFIFKDNKAHDGAGEAYTDETSELLAFIENPEKVGGKHNDIGELV